MSKEIQERADKIIRELKEAIIPIKEELNRLKGSSGNRI